MRRALVCYSHHVKILPFRVHPDAARPQTLPDGEPTGAALPRTVGDECCLGHSLEPVCTPRIPGMPLAAESSSARPPARPEEAHPPGDATAAGTDSPVQARGASAGVPQTLLWDDGLPAPGSEPLPASPGSSSPAVDLEAIRREAHDGSSHLPCTRRGTRDFVRDTATLRATVEGARQGRPGYAELLEERYGYTLASLPAPGTLFLDPYFLGEKVTDQDVRAQRFPTAPASPPAGPSIVERLFDEGRSIAVEGAAGRTVMADMAEYREFVSHERATRLGTAQASGEPVPVHLSFSGGGGKGKRYVAAYQELFRLGVVPASVAGTSAGSIAAAIAACGADPETFRALMQDERFSQLLDTFGSSAIAKGQVAYRFFEEILGDLTGIQDRPVTFQDLKLPLTVVASKYSDSDACTPESGLSTPDDRRFVFSRETTPHTPVALALRASMAIPAVFSPVEMVDPVTGRTVTLVDGGLIENMPLGHGPDGLPEVALHPIARGYGSDNRMAFRLPAFPFPQAQLLAHNVVANALHGFSLFMGSRQAQREYAGMVDPPQGTFVVNLPVWDTEQPSQGDTLLDFKYDDQVDARLDRQTAGFIDDFFRQRLGLLGQEGEHASNVKPAPALSFVHTFEHEGRTWTATYDGGRAIALRADDGTERFLLAKKRQVENWLIEHEAFGDLSGKLQEAMDKSFKSAVALADALPVDY